MVLGVKFRDVVSLAVWCMGAWIVITRTFTLESLLFGAALAVGWALLLARLGPVVAPWALLRPDRLRSVPVLAARLAVSVAKANVRLARRAWSRHPGPPSGMVIVPTRARSDGALAAVGVLSSLVVDNQIVDVDRRTSNLLYHSIVVLPPDQRYEAVLGDVEPAILRVEAGHG